MNGLNDFREWLQAEEYTICKSSFQNQINQCDWYAAKRTKIPVRDCETNDHKVQIVVYPYFYEINGKKLASCEIDVTGEYDGDWFQLKAYSVNSEKFQSKHELIESRLINAWNNLSTKKE